MKQPFAVFDIDGTLARWGLYISVVDHLIDNHLLTNEAYERTKAMYDKWKRRTHDSSFRDYELSVVRSWEQLRTEVTYTQFTQAAEAVVQAQKDHTYTYTKSLIKQLKNEGYFLIALSGSHQELIDHMTSHHGFDLGIGSKYYHENDKFTGESFVASLDKGTELKKIVDEHNLDITKSIGVGDTYGDIAMLELVNKPIAFNPDQTLRDKAIEQQWQIVIERKNCIYSLLPTNDGYKLEI